MTNARYDPQTNTYHAAITKDGSDSLYQIILRLVSIATNTAPLDLPPLYEVVDIVALENLFETANPKTAGGFVQFEYASCYVTVVLNGDIIVKPPEPGTGSSAHE